MKVILTAFEGKLFSEPMDWPEDTGYDIRMRLDIPPPPADWPSLKSAPLTVKIQKVGRFVHSGTYQVLSDGKTTAAIYVLVDI